jgi:hypothetical protein
MLTRSREVTERGIRIREDHYSTGFVEIAYYDPDNHCLAIVDRQPGTRKWHIYGVAGSRPIISLRTKTGALAWALEYAVQNLPPANIGNPGDP